MPKILITGNGFDLNLGLPTAYSDFINILKYSEIQDEINFESVYLNSSNHKKIFENFKSFSIDNTNVLKIKELTSKNIWFNFFKNELEIETWIDFENKIEYVLKILFSSVEYIRDNVFSNRLQPIINNSLTYNWKLFNDNVEIVQVLKQLNILSLKQDSNIVLNEEFLVSKYNAYIDINIDKITTQLYEELIIFKKIFNYYFETFVYPLYDNFKVKVNKNLFSTINKHYTFNYTPTFEKIYGNSSITKFLHGRINSEKNMIVLGINEVPKNNVHDKRYFLPFTKYFQKLNNNTDYVFLKEFQTKVSDNYFFFFFGHSLDKSDEDYLNEVFNFVNQLKTKTKKIIVIYHTEEAKSKLLLNILNIRGKSDIQDLMRMKILQFMHIDSTELRTELNRDITRRPISVSY